MANASKMEETESKPVIPWTMPTILIENQYNVVAVEQLKHNRTLIAITVWMASEDLLSWLQNCPSLDDITVITNMSFFLPINQSKDIG